MKQCHDGLSNTQHNATARGLYTLKVYQQQQGTKTLRPLVNHPALTTNCFQETGFGCLDLVPDPLFPGEYCPDVGATITAGMLAALHLLSLLTDLSLTGYRGVRNTRDVHLRLGSCSDVICFPIANTC